MLSKTLTKMEVLRGFIQIPARNRSEIIGNIILPCSTTLNGSPAKLDKYGRLWSPSLRGKYSSGSRVQLTKTEEGFQLSPTDNINENEEMDKKSKSKKLRKKGTATSSFGSPGRFGHDSSRFYNSRLYEGLPKEREKVVYFENEINKDHLDKVFCKSSERMEELPDNSVHLMVTLL